MRIVAGALLHECNTLTPVKTVLADFDFVRGEAALERMAVGSLFREAGVQVIPSIYASALPSGMVTAEAFQKLSGEILDTVSEVLPVDGVWLYLHGAMEVEGIGSGEANLVSRIRKIVGPSVPIAVALDFHANLTEELAKAADVICGYRTAPHTDQAETQIRAGELLLRCIREGLRPTSTMIKVPVITPGDALVTTSDPGRSLMLELETTDIVDGVLSASIFGGQPWVDAPNVGMSVVVNAVDESAGVREAKRLASLCWACRTHFHFEAETADPERAIELAFAEKAHPVFITDSGDNTTGGAPGDDAGMLGLLMAAKAEKTLVAGITDAEVVKACSSGKSGDHVELSLGGKLAKGGRNLSPAIVGMSRSVVIAGTIAWQGRILDWEGNDGCRAVVLRTSGIDILVTEDRCGIVSPEILASAQIDVDDYDIVVVKLGYLWDALRKVSKRTIIALTNGATCESIEQIEYRNVQRPVYPIDRDFDWEPDFV